MAYNEELALRIRKVLAPFEKDITEKNMFGGLCFMYKNKMSCGIVKDDLMVRVVSEKFEKKLQDPSAREMDFTGKALKNFLYVEPEGFQSEAQLTDWINLGLEHAEQHAR